MGMARPGALIHFEEVGLPTLESFKYKKEFSKDMHMEYEIKIIKNALCLKKIKTYWKYRVGNPVIVQELLYHILSHNAAVRTSAYANLIRHLRHSPGRWQAVLPTYLAAIQAVLRIQTILHRICTGSGFQNYGTGLNLT